jgi:hypothetical protein
MTAYLWRVLNIAVFGSAFAFFAGVAWGWDWYGIAVGALIGIGFGLAFGSSDETSPHSRTFW